MKSVEFNWRLFLVVLGITSAITVVVGAGYQVQRKRLSGSYRERYEQLAEGNKLKEACEVLFRYTKLRPNDQQAWTDLVTTFARIPGKEDTTIKVARNALSVVKNPDFTSEINRALAETYLKTKRYAEAGNISHRFGGKDEPYGIRIEALVKHWETRAAPVGSPERASALAMLEDASNRLPQDVDLAVLAASAIREERPESAEDADVIVDRMATHPDNSSETKAYLGRYRYRKKNHLPIVADDLRRSIQLAEASNSVGTLVDVGIIAIRTDEHDNDGIRLMKKVIELDPQRFEPYYWIGWSHDQKGNSKKAIQVWEDGMKAVTDDGILRASSPKGLLLQELARVYLRDSEIEKAEDAISDGISSHRDYSRFVSPKLAFETAALGQIRLVQHRFDLYQGQLFLRQAMSLDVESRNARLVLAQNNFRRITESIPSTAAGAAAKMRFAALQMLGDALFTAGEKEPAVVAYRSAARTAEVSAPQLGILADRLRQLREFDVAKEIDGLALLLDGSIENRITYAQSILSAQSTKQLDERDWTEFKSVIAKARADGSVSWRLYGLESQAFFLDGNNLAATTMLSNAEQLGSDDPDFWRFAAIVYQRIGQLSQADRCVSKFEKKVDEQWQVQLLRANLLTDRSDYKSALALLDKVYASDLPVEVLERVLESRFQILSIVKSQEELEKEVEDAHERFRDNSTFAGIGASLALEDNRIDDLLKWIERLKKIEGESGVQWRWFECQRLLASNESTEEVASLLKEMQLIAPDWGRASMLRGELLLRDGRRSDALNAFQAAVQRGYRNPEVFEAILTQANELDANGLSVTLFDAILDVLHANRAASVSFDSNLLSANAADIEKRIREERKRSSNAPFDQIWLAQLLILGGRESEAESLLLSTSEDTSDSRIVASLFHFYSTRDSKTAMSILPRLEATLDDMDASQRGLFLARCCLRMLRTAEAEKYLYQAVQADPDNYDLQMSLARLRYRIDTFAAIAPLRKAIELRPKNPEAKRYLINILAARGGTEDWREAEKLLKEQDSEEDATLRAVLLVQRGGERNLREAMSILQAREYPTTNETLLLAKVHEALSNVDLAFAQFKKLNDRQTLQVEHAYGEFCLRNGREQEAVEMVKECKSKLDGRSLGEQFIVHEFALRAMKRAGDISTAVKDFEQLANKELEKRKADNILSAQWCKTVGNCFRRVHLHPESERWFRRAYEFDSRQFGELARALAYQHRHKEAIEIVATNSEEDSHPLVLLQLVDLLATGNASPDSWARLGDLFASSEREYPNSFERKYSVALANAIRGKQVLAIAQLERLLVERPGNIMLLNNLATLLGETASGRERALRLIESAIAGYGRKSALLDTKAMILVELGQSDLAVRELKHLAASARPDSRILFRLAVAYHRLGKPEESAKQMTRALGLGVAEEVLTEHDRKLMKEVMEAVL